jgi:hypothetical protein
MIPQVGQPVEVVVDNSFAHSYVSATSKHRAPPTMTLRGIVIETPAHMRPHTGLSLLNMHNLVRNHIPGHRIISIGGVTVEKKPETKDRHFEVVSSKTGEKYQVMQNGLTKNWSCTCTGFQFHKKCRHVTRIMEQEE